MENLRNGVRLKEKTTSKGEYLEARLRYDTLLELMEMSEIKGQTDALKTAGKGLIGTGVLWFIIGKLGSVVAKKIAEKHEL